MQTQENQSIEFNLESTSEDRKTLSANYVSVTNNSAEFVIDFYHLFAPQKNARLQSRVSLPPIIAKSFLEALATQVEDFETKNGEIRDSSEPLPSIGFRPNR